MEAIKLDDAGVASGRTELDITPWIKQEGIDFGDAAIQAFLAQREYGEVPVDARVPNRVVTIPLIILDWDSTTFAEFRTQLQAKAALFQRERGWVSRDTSVGKVYADVQSATLKLGGSTAQALDLYDADAVLTLECLPDWYGDEVVASPPHDETALPDLVWVETGIEGNYAGRCRMSITERNGQDRLGLIWGLRSRHYDAASTARLAYEAEALTPMDTAAADTQSGASGGSVIEHLNLPTSWTPILNTNLLAGDYLTHAGTYQVFARVQQAGSSSPATSLRFVWDIGDMTNPVENAPWEPPTGLNWFLADLGQIHIAETPLGTHRWQGQIQGKGDVGGEQIQIDRIYFQPLDEAAGMLRAVPHPTLGLSTYTARDEFNQTAGALNGKTLPVGGTWGGAGDPDDFSVETTGKTVQRTAVSDASFTSSSLEGRLALAGLSVFTDVFVQVDFKATAWGGEMVQGVAARYVSQTNFGGACLHYNSITDKYTLRVFKTAGTTVRDVEIFRPVAGEWYTVGILIRASGAGVAWIGPQGSGTQVTLPFYDATFLAPNTLDDGQSGILDGNASATASTRNYDNFVTGVPVTDAVMFANQSVELTTDGIYREDSAGAAYGPVPEVIGDYPRVPPAGLEGRSLEVFVLPSRGEIRELNDIAIEDVRGQLFYRPSWLFVPDDIGS